MSTVATVFVLVAAILGGSAHAEDLSPQQKKDAVAAAAWQQVYSVLTHPRCINCHTATNYPQQGDDRHRHFANVVRGQTGDGVLKRFWVA